MVYNDANDLPKKTFVRRSLTMHNPPKFKSGADGLTYKATGRTVDLPYVKPKGKIYVAPDDKEVPNEWEKLRPFESVFVKELRNKGMVRPDNFPDLVKAFYNHKIAAKGFNGAKPLNFEAMDNADDVAAHDIVEQTFTYIRSLLTGAQPNGAALNSNDIKTASDVKTIVNDLQVKVANSGLSPQDKIASGVVAPMPKPSSFIKSPAFKLIVGAAVVLLIIKFVF